MKIDQTIIIYKTLQLLKSSSQIIFPKINKLTLKKKKNSGVSRWSMFAKFRENFTQKFLSKDTYPSLHLLTYKFKPPNESFPNDSTKEKETLFLLILIFKILTIIFTQKKKRKRIIGIRFLHSCTFSKGGN